MRKRTHSYFYIFVTYSFMARFVLLQNRMILVQTEAPSLRLHERHSHLLPIYTLEGKFFDKKSNFYQNTLNPVDPIKRQSYPFATDLPCEGNSVNIIASDPNGNVVFGTNTSAKNTRPIGSVLNL